MHNPLRIKREEWLGVAMTTLVFSVFHALSIRKFFPLFAHHLHGGLWKVFVRHYHLSGYDPKMYSMITRWSTEYDPGRHPLLNLFLFPFYKLNQWLIGMTGVNCMQFIVAVILVLLAVYSFVYLFRILREAIGLRWGDSMLLTAFFFSFAYIHLALLAPDHFAWSMTLLLYTLYVAGMKMKRGWPFTIWQATLLFFVTSGVTLTNGAKTLLALFFVNGRRLFKPQLLLMAIVIPIFLLAGLYQYENTVFVKPRMEAMRNANAKKKVDSVAIQKAQAVLKVTATKPFSTKPGLNMTDASTPRIPTIVENLFGESLQFHEDYFLCDITNGDHLRPVFVNYRHWWNYAAEALCVTLLILGIWAGRRQRFQWLGLSFFAIDMGLHVVLGFAINEIYIMTAHWAFIIPMSIAWLLHHKRLRPLTLSAVALLTIWFWWHNGQLLLGELLS